MTITFNDELAKPIGISVTPTAGGSIGAGDYWVGICATDKESYRNDDTPARRGIVAINGSYTLSGGNGTLVIQWDQVSGATHYNVYITEAASGDDRWVGTRIKRTSDASQYMATVADSGGATTSITLTDESLFGGYVHDSFAYDDSYPMPGGFGKSGAGGGEGTLILTGSCGTVTLDALAAAVTNSALIYWDGFFFALKGGIEIQSGATGSLLIGEGVRFMPWHGNFGQNASGFTTTFYRCQWDVTGMSSRAGFENCVLEDMVLNMNSWSGCELQNALLASDQSVNWYSTGVDNGGVVIRGSNPNIQTGVSIDNLTVVGGNLFLGVVVDTISLTNSVINGYIGIPLAGYLESDDVVVRDVEVAVGGIRQLYIQQAWVDDFVLNDVDFSGIADGNQPGMLWAAAAQSNDLYLARSFDVTVLDWKGELQQGANVMVWDVGGSVVVNENTGADGEIDTQDVKVMLVEYAGPGSTDTAYTEQGPFTIKVFKPGYDVVTRILPTFDRKVSLTFALQRRKQHRWRRG